MINYYILRRMERIFKTNTKYWINKFKGERWTVHIFLGTYIEKMYQCVMIQWKKYLDTLQSFTIQG